MDNEVCRRLFDFYSDELRNNILRFWLSRCEDTQFGGYLNCFDNRGTKLVSHDKYTWSQGRFLWMFSKLAMTKAPLFTEEERNRFLDLAETGYQFLKEHCLISKDDWRCVFLTERDGTPKRVGNYDTLDMSIYADCFVVLGLGMYAAVSGDAEAYGFAKTLYESVVAKVHAGSFNTLPYPLSGKFRAHGIPMILDNTARELLRAAELLDADYAGWLKKDMEGFAADILMNFTDEDQVVHEVITAENEMFPQILGQHQNPGHTIEDVWFLLDAAEICDKPGWKKQIYMMAKKALRNGWDEEYGGLLHFCGIDGGEPEGDDTGVADEPMTKQLAGWGDKLWWVHSEALYSTLRCWLETGDPEFLAWHDKVFAYVYRTFPNRDPEIREWKQIRMRDGSPQEKVVALPVKDPFHIIRNLILIIELLS
jgi:N-acylglucosamine 2-epimerase